MGWDRLTIQCKNQTNPVCIYNLTIKHMFLAVRFNRGKKLRHEIDTGIFSGFYKVAICHAIVAASGLKQTHLTEKDVNVVNGKTLRI